MIAGYARFRSPTSIEVDGGRLQFTHVAGRMGWIAATNALSKLARIRGLRLDASATHLPLSHVEAALAMQTGMFVGRLAQTSHAYPTWSMAIQQAALQFFGESAGLRARPIDQAMAARGISDQIRARTGHE